MRGHITQRTKRKDRWSLVVYVSVTDKDTGDRKLVQRWETVRGTRKDAENRLAELIDAINKGSEKLLDTALDAAGVAKEYQEAIKKGIERGAKTKFIE